MVDFCKTFLLFVSKAPATLQEDFIPTSQNIQTKPTTLKKTAERNTCNLETKNSLQLEVVRFTAHFFVLTFTTKCNC